MKKQTSVQLVCPCCGSDSIYWEATAYWNLALQSFKLSDSQVGFGNCAECMAEFRTADEKIITVDCDIT